VGDYDNVHPKRAFLSFADETRGAIAYYADGGGPPYGAARTEDHGTSWQEFTAPVGQRAFLFVGPDDVWTLARATITGTGGRSFTAPDSLYAMAFPTPDKGWVVGAHGAVYCTENGGRGWTLQESGVGVSLHDVFFLGEHHGWAVGDGGTLLRYH
jgi:photosystem II stability/assembly factor-like uncharacterized protein